MLGVYENTCFQNTALNCLPYNSYDV